MNGTLRRWIANERRGAVLEDHWHVEENKSLYLYRWWRARGGPGAQRAGRDSRFSGESRKKNLRMGLGAQHL